MYSGRPAIIVLRIPKQLVPRMKELLCRLGFRIESDL